MISHRGNITAGVVAFTLAATYVGCGGSTAANHDNGNSEAGDSGVAVVDTGTGTITPVDSGTAADTGASVVDAAPEANNGAPSTTYPAFTVDVAQVVDNGGPTLAAPVVVTVTWSSDPNATVDEAMGDAIGPSTYWSDINSEYAVGPATSGNPNHVSITTTPLASYADTDLDSLVEANAGKTWPASTANTIYAIYLPPGTSLTSGGQDLCQQNVGGYHTESQTKNYVYAIMPDCPGFAASDVELSASHELNEAATDPHPGTNPAYVGFDGDHLAFEFFNQFQDELGDACEAFTTSDDPTDLAPYNAQRQWSNKSAKAGSQWCVPKLAEPFYNTTFLPATNLDTISVNLNTIYPGAGTQQSKGFKVALNTARTFPLGLFSDMATTAPFTLDIQGLGQPIAQDQQGNVINNGTATVTLDKTSGVNGEITNVTVTPTAYSSLGIIYFYVRAQLPGAQAHHYLPVLISQN